TNPASTVSGRVLCAKPASFPAYVIRGTRKRLWKSVLRLGTRRRWPKTDSSHARQSQKSPKTDPLQ
ncbi:hypothetical protein BaRGS_00025953, partial [Batillaria attramentaria]